MMQVATRFERRQNNAKNENVVYSYIAIVNERKTFHFPSLCKMENPELFKIVRSIFMLQINL